MKSCKSAAFVFPLANKAWCRSETSKHIKPLCFAVNAAKAAKAVCIRAAFTGLLCDSLYPRSVCFLPLIIFLSAFKHWQCANTAPKHKCERARTIKYHWRCCQSTSTRKQRGRMYTRETHVYRVVRWLAHLTPDQVSESVAKISETEIPRSAVQSQDAVEKHLIRAQF